MSNNDKKPENNIISKGSEMDISVKNKNNMLNSESNINNKIGGLTTDDNKNIESTKGKCSLSLKAKIIIISAISLVIALAILLPVLLIKKKNKKIILDETTNTDIFESQTIEEPVTTINNEEEIIMMDYSEAEALIGSETVKEIHYLLNESSNNLDDLLIMCDNISFSKINATINPLPENLDELINNFNESTNGSFEIFKSDLDLYHSKYTSFSEEVDTLTEEFSATINFTSTKIGELKNDLNNFTDHFEKMIQNISIPYSSNLNKTEKSLRNLDLVGDNNVLIFNEADFKNLNEMVEKIEKTVKNWVSLMKIVYNFLFYINDKSMAGISNFN